MEVFIYRHGRTLQAGRMRGKMNLEGIWRFGLDEEDHGITEKWYCRQLQDKIRVSGTLQAQGYGSEISADTPLIDGLHDRLWFLREEVRDFAWDGAVRVPFLAQPVRHYLGAAWYQREIEIPKEWEGRQLTLFMELVRWKSTVWIDDVCMGSFTSLCVPHQYRIGGLCAGTHRLTVRTDNRMIYPYRPDAHGVSDSVGHSWNGIAGKIELTVQNTVFIEKAVVYPDYRSKSARVKVSLANTGGKTRCRLSVYKTVNCPGIGTSAVEGEPKGCAVTKEASEKAGNKDENFLYISDISAGKGSTEVEFSVAFGDEALCWDEFTPTLQKLDIRLCREDGQFLDQKTLRFGLRNIAAAGRKILLNGRAVCFRGTHDAGCFPLTGYPASDVESWQRIFSICKEWGMNHVRFHSWCPPEAAFLAADEAGIYLQVETGMWNYFTSDGEIAEQLFLETDRILEAFGNHPSFVMLSSGNEPHGNYKPVVERWVEKYRREDGRRLYCAQSGWLWPMNPEELHITDYLYTCSRYNTSKMRGREGWFGSNYSKYMEDIEIPFLCHELGQYCAYPDFSQIEKFTGYLTPSNYECYRRLAKRHGLLERNSDFVKASGMLQFLAYKEEIEANLRTPEFSGFSLLDLHDYPGQGGALVGLLDVFWDPKPYADVREFRRFCAPTTALAGIPKVVYCTNEQFRAGIEIACYEKEDMEKALIYWKVTDKEGEIYLQGSFEKMRIRTGGNTYVGNLSFPLSGLPAPRSYFLLVGIEGTSVENRWKLWVYPQKADCTVPEGIRVTVTLAETVRALGEGKKVLFLPRAEDIHYNSPMLSSLPVFWNGRMGPKWCRGLGMWCDSSHKALREFPTENGMEWQWSEIVEGARGMNVEGLPKQLRPILCPIDDWNRSYRLALAFEAKMCGGKLMVCSANLLENQDQRPAARQLLHSFLKYMYSSDFAPEVSVTEAQLKTFLADTAIMRKIQAKVRVVEGYEEEKEQSRTGNEERGMSAVKAAAVEEKMPTAAKAAMSNPVENILNGDPNTYWLAGGKYGGHYPFMLEFETAKAVLVKGLLIMPRQNHRDWEGQVKRYEVYIEQNGQWLKLCEGELAASPDAKEILFPERVILKKLRLRLLEGFGAGNLSYWDRRAGTGFCMVREDYVDECVSLAEVDFLCDEALAEESIRVEYREGITASEEIY